MAADPTTMALLIASFGILPGSPEHVLAQWVRAEGGFVGSLVAERRGGYRCLFVSEDVPSGEVLVEVPQHASQAHDVIRTSVRLRHCWPYGTYESMYHVSAMN